MIALAIAIYGLKGSKTMALIAIGLHGLGILYIIMLFNGM